MAELRDPPLAPHNGDGNDPHYRAVLREWRRQLIDWLREKYTELTDKTDELERTRNIWCSAYKSGSTQVLTAGVAAKVLFQTEAWDKGGDFASSTFTAPRDGKYEIESSVAFNVTGAADVLRVRIYKNGVNFVNSYLTVGDASTHTVSINKTLELVQGDTIDIYALNSTNNDTIAQGNGSTWVEIQYKGE